MTNTANTVERLLEMLRGSRVNFDTSSSSAWAIAFAQWYNAERAALQQRQEACPWATLDTVVTLASNSNARDSQCLSVSLDRLISAHAVSSTEVEATFDGWYKAHTVCIDVTECEVWEKGKYYEDE